MSTQMMILVSTNKRNSVCFRLQYPNRMTPLKVPNEDSTLCARQIWFYFQFKAQKDALCLWEPDLIGDKYNINIDLKRLTANMKVHTVVIQTMIPSIQSLWLFIQASLSDTASIFITFSFLVLCLLFPQVILLWQIVSNTGDVSFWQKLLTL